MIEVKAYMTTDCEEVANKVLEEAGTFIGDIRSSINLYDEVILRIEKDVHPLFTMNYAWIGAPYNRYYMIDKVDCICDGIYDLTLRSDVLMSFKSYFPSWEGIVKRQENKFNLMLNDGSFKVYQNPIIIQKTFPQGFSGQEYVLVCAGKPIEPET